MGKVVSVEDAVAELDRVRSGKKVVFTNGCFDILHVGHIRYLKEARAQGDILVVGVDTDESVQALKGPTRPIQNESERAEILAALEVVDFVIHFGDGNPLPLIEAVKPDVLVKGGDWSVEKIVGASFVQSYGGEVKPLQFVQGRSTTDIVSKIKLADN